jgi:hypothetical protein
MRSKDLISLCRSQFRLDRYMDKRGRPCLVAREIVFRQLNQSAPVIIL